MVGIPAFYSNFLFLFWSQFFKLNFLKPTLFSFGYDCYASVRKGASQFYFIAEAPSNPLFTLLVLGQCVNGAARSHKLTFCRPAKLIQFITQNFIQP